MDLSLRIIPVPKSSSFIVLGNALTCQKCRYSSERPKEEQKCDPNNIVNCTSGYCVTAKFTGKNGVVHVGRDCDDIEPDRKECPNPEKQCIEAIKTEGP